jgi:hypothetical protein
VESIFQLLKRKLKPTHKFISALRLIEKDTSQDFKSKLLARERIFSSLTKCPSYAEVQKVIPKNSLYIIVQLNKTKTKMMVGVMESESDPANRKFKGKMKAVTDKELKAYKKIMETLLEHKKKLTKLSYEDEVKIENTIVENESKIRELKNTL